VPGADPRGKEGGKKEGKEGEKERAGGGWATTAGSFRRREKTRRNFFDKIGKGEGRKGKGKEKK